MTSLTDNDLMRECCQMAVKHELAWHSFRSLPGFLYAMENFSPEAAKAVIEAVPHTDLKPELFASDLGKPPTVALPDGRHISPSMLRYSAISRDMGKRFQMHGANIVEIGCGFGGQCKVIRTHYERGAYLCVDTPYMVEVASKYLAHFAETKDVGILESTSFRTPPHETFLKGLNAICVSNYAFSELDDSVQELYFENLVRRCPRGFFIWNEPPTPFDSWTMEEFCEKLKALGRVVTIEDEPVKTGEGIKLVRWGK